MCRTKSFARPSPLPEPAAWPRWKRKSSSKNTAATLNENVYLLLHNGALIQVSQKDYWAKPALRVFLSGTTTQVIQQRPKQLTIPAHSGD